MVIGAALLERTNMAMAQTKARPEEKVVRLEEPDELLMARLRDGDERAMSLIVGKHGPAVFGMAKRVTVDKALAEEVAQDTFLALWRKPEAFNRARGSLRGYLLVLARNKAVDAVRRQQTHVRALQKVEPAPEFASYTDAVDDRQEIARALHQLSERQQEAVYLAYFAGLTYREVARHLGIPEGTAKTRLHDGLKMLRTVLGATQKTSPNGRNNGHKRTN